MPLITGDKSEKVVFVIVNIALAYVWLSFIMRLIARWNVMNPSIHGPVGLFMMFFSLWWLSSLIGGKRRFAPAPLLMAGGVLMTVYAIVRAF
jgi:hypothetical protein